MILYTDGSAYHADGSAGYGIVYVEEGRLSYHAKFGCLPEGTTTQQAELWAVIYGLNEIYTPEPIIVRSDSSYVVDSMNDYAFGWLSRALRWQGLQTFPNDRVVDLHRMLREAIGSQVPLGLENASQELIANQYEWEQLWTLMREMYLDVTFEKVTGHSGDRFNDIADFLAGQGRDMAYDAHDIPRLTNSRDRRLR